MVALDVDMRPNERDQDWGFGLSSWVRLLPEREFGSEWVAESVGGRNHLFQKTK